MHFEGVVNNQGAGIDIIIITLEEKIIPMAKRLEFEVINNQAEYETCIFGLEALRSVRAENITIYGDSILIVKHASKEWEVTEDRLRLY